ncbi:PAS domain S-box-containing protein/diguanylate cyclase (GGDEF) domain-containing protein [Epsilonproteobacteria bacterium SCGC AD-311-C15]|nr:PAS domain S-box-containing protein/diguanylate cyclase (GGDEF) domain-containing protein [Epsilonproteobacteria bacterium SCGC AD-311-C15]
MNNYDKSHSLNIATEDRTIHIGKRIAYDKLTYFYLSMPVVIIGHMLGALLLSALLYRVIDVYNIFVWLGLSVIFFFYRFYHYYLFKREEEHKKMRDYRIWIDRFYADVLISALLWGSSAILMFPAGDIMNQMIIVIFIFAVSFTSMGNIGAKLDLLIFYAFFSFLPLIIQLIVLGQQQYVQLGILVIALMIVLMAVSYYFGNVVNNSLYNHQNFIEIKHSNEILQERFFSLFERAPVGIFYYNDKLEILDSNTFFSELNDCESKEDLVNKSIKYTSNKELLDSYKIVFQNTIGDYRGPYTSLMSDKQLYVDLNTVPLIDAGGIVKGGITIVKDITEEVNAKESMVRNAYYDILTNIPNRTLFMDRLNEAIESSKKEHTFAAVLYMDLDNFKKLNETFGHDKGDSALKQVAERALNTINAQDTLARLGGDKFAVLLPNLTHDYNSAYEQAMKKAQNILDVLITPLKISGEDYHAGASIGIYLFPSNGATAYDILKRAETAMYEAKRTGRNTIMPYQDYMGDSVAEFIGIDNDLRKALLNDELMMYYHPQLDVQTGKISGAEALIRWAHPTRGMVPPAKFIPIAEESGYIIELSHWILERVIKDIKRLSELPGGFKLNHIAININSNHFLRPDFTKELKSIIEKHHIPAKWVEIEITEGVIMDNIDEAIKKMKELKEYGIKFSMDDFGTGYSSLSYLSQLPFDTLKIDQAFVMKMTNDISDSTLVYAIIDIAKNFNFEVVAEGVETLEILELLQKSTCNIYQGFYAHKPMPLSDFTKLIS